MQESLLIVARQVAILFALVSVGFVCNRKKLVAETAVKGMVEILVLIVTPCLIVHAFQRPFEPRLLAGLAWAAGGAIFAHLLGILAATVCFHSRNNPDRTAVLRFATVFSNAGFMGIPLEQALLGTEGVFYGAVYVVVFNLFCWSYGLVLMCGDLKSARLRTLFVNPGSIGILLGLPFFIFSRTLPEVIDTPVKMLADLNTPLAMIVIGFYLAQASLREVRTCASAYGAAFLRLLVIPLSVLGIFWLIRPPYPVMVVALVTAVSAPAAALTTMFAARHGRDVSVSVGLVSGTTLLSILTMPPIVGLALWLFR